ncbi:hypothetical protein [Exilibacterium tricleocarpae]|uniref:hypothetical protein n=1 Tax=Exilibacterium tricleocarpae TaxID=2591008 RepID=UPI0015D193BA|nr:hypothetical protein [Exilibacterium tricleocarpae]
MNSQRPLMFLLLVLYVFSPTLFNWMINPDGAWYRPYIIWMLVIVIAYVIQNRRQRHDI